MFSRCSLLLLLAGMASAQQTPPVFSVPPDLLAGFALRDGTVQNLTLPRTNAMPFQASVVLAGSGRTLSLVPHDVRSPDFRLLVDDGASLRQEPTPPAVTYRGEVVGLAGSEVAATLVDGQLSATLHLADGSLWAVQPLTVVNPALPRESHVVYRASDVIHPDAHCGVALTARGLDVGQGGPAPAAMKIAELAIDADRAYYVRYGSNTTTVQNQVTSVINSVDVIYRRDVEIDYTITSIVVRTTSVYSWSGDLCALLGQFGNYWNVNHGGIRRDLAHLFTGEGSFSGVIGCAYLGVVCTGSAYGASKAYSANLTTNTGLVAHEMGHNWNAPHCDASSPCNIMCSGLGGCSGNLSSFETTSRNTIISYKNSRGCLGDPLPPVLTGLTPSATTSYQPVPITVTGTGLDSVSVLTVGGRNVAFTPLTSTALRFTPPAPSAIGPQAVVATNSAGASNPVNLTITGNHPSVLTSTSLLLRGFPNRMDLHSDAGWVGALLFSTSNAPSSLPGVVDLGIGNGFTELFDLGFVPCGADGAGTVNVTLPVNAPSGLILYWQALTFDPLNPTMPFEVSNVRQTQIL